MRLSGAPNDTMNPSLSPHPKQVRRTQPELPHMIKALRGNSVCLLPHMHMKQDKPMTQQEPTAGRSGLY